MIQSNLRYSTLAILISAASLTACGGGGGGGGGGDTRPGPQQEALMAIDATNAQTAASEAYYSNSLATDVASAVGSDFVTGAVVEERVGEEIPLVSIVNQHVELAQSSIQQASLDFVSGVRIERTSAACDFGGVLYVSGDLAQSTIDSDLEVFRTGDTITTEYSNCNLGEGVLLSGSFTLTFGAADGNEINDITIDYDDFTFSFASADLTDGLNGDITVEGIVRLIDSQSGNVFSQEVSGNYLIASISVDNRQVYASTLLDFAMTSSLDDTDGDVTESGDFITQGSDIDGSIEVTTITPFVTVSGEEFPGAGSLIAEGDNSSVTLTALNSSSVQLEIDENGDNVIDVTLVQSWDSL